MWRNWRVKCHGDNRRKFKWVSTFELQPIWSRIKSLQLIWYRYGSSEAVMRSIQLNSLQHLQTIQFNTINKGSNRDDPTEEPKRLPGLPGIQHWGTPSEHSSTGTPGQFRTEGLPLNIEIAGTPGPIQHQGLPRNIEIPAFNSGTPARMDSPTAGGSNDEGVEVLNTHHRHFLQVIRPF